MKVLHLSSEKTWRGGEQQIAYLIEESTKLGIENHVASRKNSAFSSYCKKSNLSYIELGFRNEIDIFTAIAIKKYCTSNQIDIVHIHSSHSQAMAVLSAVFGNKSKLILSRKVDFPIKSNLLSRWKFNHSSIQKIICVSDAIRKIILPDLDNKTICEVVHDGIDIQRFPHSKGRNKLRKEYKIPLHKQIVANISAIAPHKHYFTFVDTAEKVLAHNPNFHFFILGDGPLRFEIESYIKTKNLEENITLTGFRQDIPEIFPDVDLFLMTSETEGLGSTLLDAAANHVPIVTTNAGGIPEFVEHNKTGLLSPVYDSESLANHIIQLSGNEELKKTMTQNAFNKMNQGFTKQIMTQKTIEIYDRLDS